MAFRKLVGKLEDKLPKMGGTGDGAANLGPSQPPPRPSYPPTSQPPSRADVYRFRTQRGVNLGSLFSLEAWLVPSLFQGCKPGADSEMDLLTSPLPRDEVKRRLESHWQRFVDEGDWQWMASQGVNTVRIPIGYWHFLPGAGLTHLLQGTEYQAFADVYANAWQNVCRVIDTAARYGIGVLVDLHGAPGAQNAEGHSGLSTKRASLWQGASAAENQRRTLDILVHLAQHVRRYEHVVGLELLNEPQNSSHLQRFYDACVAAIRCAGVSELPLYVGDAWDLGNYTRWTSSRRPDLGFLVVDHHLYRCFTGEDTRTPAAEHARRIEPRGGGPTASWLSGECHTAGRSVVVGEWSAALNPGSMPGGGADAEARRGWAQSQLSAYREYCAGNFFWTLKKEGAPDAGWCLYAAVEQGALPPGLGAPSVRDVRGWDDGASEAARGQARQAAVGGHAAYWQANSGGRTMEHWRFEQGFDVGWRDARAFWQTDDVAARGGGGGGGDAQAIPAKLGFVGQWAWQRSRAHEAEAGVGNVWEFEHGLHQGIAAFHAFVGV